MGAVLIRPLETRMLGIIARHVDAGAPCPTNEQLCRLLGFKSPASPARILSVLVAAGLAAAEWPNRQSRIVTITAAGRAWLAKAPPMVLERTLAAPRLRGRPAGSRTDAPVNVARLAPIADGEERTHRTAAAASNARFLSALAKVRIPVEPPARPERAFRELPPPALTAQANS